MSMLASIIRGGPAHQDPMACLEDLPWEAAGRRVTGLPHTIWQLVGHMNYWMDLELRCIEGDEVPYPRHSSESWPATEGPANAETWQYQLGFLRDHLGQLATLADARASTLARIVHPKKGTTVEELLLVLAAHNSYHVGQIVHLRQALGVWPPAAGGMKW
jgi:uncharacterized damage-inducible protein DinB